MPLTLAPLAANADNVSSPVSKILLGIRRKIEDTGLSFQQFLAARGYRAVHVYDQTLESEGRIGYDPPMSECPAVVLLTDAHPPTDDRGIGNEIWTFEVGVMLKMELRDQDVTDALDAWWELARTIMVANKQPQLDPYLGTGAIPGLQDFKIVGAMSPPSSAATREGFRAASGSFILQFRLVANILESTGD